MKISYSQKNIRFELSELPQLKCDESQIKQLFQNLLENAIKFNDKEFIEIKISSSVFENGTKFTISDNGQGIRSENLDHIFDLFYKNQNGTHEHKGQGIGLAIFKEIVENHFGKIWVESEFGQGSSFHFTLLPIK